MKLYEIEYFDADGALFDVRYVKSSSIKGALKKIKNNILYVIEKIEKKEENIFKIFIIFGNSYYIKITEKKGV